MSSKYKQMRVSQEQYDTLKALSETLGKGRPEILSNAIGLIGKIAQYDVESIKIVCKDGTEKEIFLSIVV